MKTNEHDLIKHKELNEKSLFSLFDYTLDRRLQTSFLNR